MPTYRTTQGRDLERPDVVTDVQLHQELHEEPSAFDAFLAKWWVRWLLVVPGFIILAMVLLGYALMLLEGVFG